LDLPEYNIRPTERREYGGNTEGKWRGNGGEIVQDTNNAHPGNRGKGLVRIRGVGVFLKGGMGTSYYLIPYQPSMPPLFRRTHMPKGYGYGKKKPLKRKPAKGGKKK
jgi:hypothetical protein